jgi:hypothetical protein
MLTVQQKISPATRCGVSAKTILRRSAADIASLGEGRAESRRILRRSRGQAGLMPATALRRGGKNQSKPDHRQRAHVEHG